MVGWWLFGVVYGEPLWAVRDEWREPFSVSGRVRHVYLAESASGSGFLTRCREVIVGLARCCGDPIGRVGIIAGSEHSLRWGTTQKGGGVHDKR